MENDEPLDRKVTVVGAGFSGLVTAFYLVREGFDVQVIEARPRVGGLIQTVEDDFGLVETAANGVLNTEAIEDLFRSIGVEIQPTLKASRKRFIFRRGIPQRWPLSWRASLRLLKFLFLYFVSRSWLRPRPLETVRDWGNRAIGREATDYGLEAALQGIYAGDPGKMSASLLFGRHFRLKAPRKQPAIRGTVSALHGMGEVMTKLREYLEKKDVRFSLGQEFAFRESHSPRSPVVLAVSAHAASKLVAPLDPERARALAKVELLPILSATVFFQEPIENARGFGCLFPPREKRAALGVLMNNFIFPNRAKRGYSETWIFGGASLVSAQTLLLNDQQVLDVIDRERRECFGSASPRLHARITRWPAALPHYTLELESLLPALKKNRQNVYLIGNYLGEIGLSRIIDLARQTAREVATSGQWEQRA